MTAGEFIAVAAVQAAKLGLETAWDAIERGLRNEHPEIAAAPPASSGAAIEAEDEAVIARRHGESR